MNQPSILVVDDNKSNIRILNELLRDDYAIRAATNGVDALQQASSEEPPDLILLKAGPLDNQEWESMKTHTEIGAKILNGSESPYLQMAEDIALYHHERWDGQGYPRGLKGEAIPTTARIMNIADQYDALRSKRPYKPAFAHQKAVSIITQGEGRTLPEHFDPAVLAAFSKMADTLADIFETHKDEWER